MKILLYILGSMLIPHTVFCSLRQDYDVGWPKRDHPDAVRLNKKFWERENVRKEYDVLNDEISLITKKLEKIDQKLYLESLKTKGKEKSDSGDESGSGSDISDHSDSDDETFSPIKMSEAKLEYDLFHKNQRRELRKQAEANLKIRPSAAAIAKNNKEFSVQYERAQRTYDRIIRNMRNNEKKKEIARNDILYRIFACKKPFDDAEINYLITKCTVSNIKDSTIVNKKQTMAHWCLGQKAFNSFLARLGDIQEVAKRIALGLKLFIGWGVDVNAPNYKGDTPLHRAMKKYNNKAVVSLGKAGANPNAQNYSGNIPLVPLLRNHSTEMLYPKQKVLSRVVRSYLRLKPDLTITNKGDESVTSLVADKGIFMLPRIRKKIDNYNYRQKIAKYAST